MEHMHKQAQGTITVVANGYSQVVPGSFVPYPLKNTRCLHIGVEQYNIREYEIEPYATNRMLRFSPSGVERRLNKVWNARPRCGA